MEGIVEENGSSMDPLSGSQSSSSDQGNTQSGTTAAALTSSANIVQLIPTQANAQSVIQPNQQSVIQQATGQPVKSVLLVSKPNSVIHTTQGINMHTVQVNRNVNRFSHMPSPQSMYDIQQIKPEPHGGQMMDSDDDSCTDDDSPKKRRDLLTRRPSYRKILNDLGGGEIGGTIQLTSQGGQGEPPGLHTITSGSGGTIVQYSTGQDSHIYVPVNIVGGSVIAEDQTRKREMRLLKNREAARECRRKKKEYIKCLENRVAVLENQNKALIEELKSLKELYCQQKND